MSPLLFIPIIKIVSRLLRQVVVNKDMEPFKVRGTEVESNITYADDFILSSKASPKSSRAIF